ncbi:MAG: glucose-6-phosphate isomerase [Deltaproteobacteria bacterium]|nr:glucose-6-phosphate isomerase [Deltaproteobacteria bacterium]
MARADLLLDYENVMAEKVGRKEGFVLSEIESLVKNIQTIQKGLVNLRHLGQLPFWDLPFNEEESGRIVKSAEAKRKEFDHFILIGIGGSSLGAETLQAALGASHKKKKFYLIDHLDSDRIQQMLEELEPRKTCLIVVSKSGKTFESLATLLVLRKFLKDKLGIGYRRHVVLITDPFSGPLRKMATEEKLESFAIPPGVGGRFSVLTAAGLFPAACFGVDVQELLAGARRMEERVRKRDLAQNPAILSAIIHYLFATRKKRRIRVMMTYAEGLRKYGDWFGQLWAESLGKRYSLGGKKVNAGSTPVAATGVRDQHSQLQLYLEGPDDKVINFVTVEKGESLPIPESPPSLGVEGRQLAKVGLRELLKIEEKATIDALTGEKRPNLSYRLPVLNAFTLGQLLFSSEVETVYAGELWGINPFDQPAVEIIKKNIQNQLWKG